MPHQEPGSWLAGGKRMSLDRIEWVVMPDPGTASAAPNLAPLKPSGDYVTPSSDVESLQFFADELLDLALRGVNRAHQHSQRA